MAASNLYLGLQRGQNNNIFNIVPATTSGGTAVDVELRIQLDPGTGPTGITSLDVNLIMDTIRQFINSRGLNHAGAGLPVL